MVCSGHAENTLNAREPRTCRNPSERWSWSLPDNADTIFRHCHRRKLMSHKISGSCGLTWRGRCSAYARVACLAGVHAIFIAQAQGEILTFSSLLERARSGEPGYLSARADVDVADARVGQAFGTMLPQISITGSTHANDRNYETRSSYVPEERDRYNGNSTQISLTQPLWRYENILGWRQSRRVAEQARYALTGAEQLLFSRVASSWFDFLAARDAVVFTERQAAAYELEWKTLRRGEELGDNSLVEVEDARASLDQALSDQITAQAEVQLKQAALEQLSGALGDFAAPWLRDVAELEFSSRETLEDWLAGIESGNPGLLVANRAFEAAAAEVGKQRAGHYPTLDLVASYGKNSQQVGGFPGQEGYDIKQGSIGLQLNVPVFSGGTQSAKVKEALAQQEKARLEMEAARRAATLEIKQAWFLWQSGMARAQAGRQAISAARLLLAQSRKGEELGLNTGFEILRAEQQLQAGERDFRKARYDQIVARVRLKAAVGTLSEEDVAAIDALLVPERESGLPGVTQGK
jgi:outer membrane protein